MYVTICNFPSLNQVGRIPQLVYCCKTNYSKTLNHKTINIFNLFWFLWVRNLGVVSWVVQAVVSSEGMIVAGGPTSKVDPYMAGLWVLAAFWRHPFLSAWASP